MPSTRAARPTPLLTVRRARTLLRSLETAEDLQAIADVLAEVGWQPALKTPWGPLLEDLAGVGSGAWALTVLGRWVRDARRIPLVAALRSESSRAAMVRGYHGTEESLVLSLAAVLRPRVAGHLEVRLLASTGRLVDRRQPPPGGMARSAAWRTWLARFGLEGLLELPVAELVERASSDVTGRWLAARGDWTPAGALDARIYRGRNRWTRAARTVPAEVRDQLGQELREAVLRDRLAAEEELPEPPDPEARPNTAAVAGELRELLEVVEGRCGRRWELNPQPHRVSLEMDPPVLRWGEAWRSRDTREVEARLTGGVQVRLEGGGEPPCRLLRGALRGFLEALEACERQAELHARLEEDLGLRPVDRLLAHLAAPAQEAALGWGLREDQVGLWLSPLWCTRRKSGKLKTRLVKRDDLVRLELALDPALDIGALTALLGLRATRARWGASSYKEMLHHPARIALALDRLAGHPRLLLQIGGERPLRVRHQELELGVRRLEGGGVELDVRVGGRPLEPEERRRIAADSTIGAPWLLLDQESSTATLVTSTPRQRAMVGALERLGGRLDADAVATVVGAVPTLQSDIQVSLDRELAGEEVPPDPRLVVRLELVPDGLLVGLWARPLPDAGVLVPGRGAEAVYGARDGARVHARRDHRAERRAVAELVDELGLPEQEEGPRLAWRLELGEASAACVAQLRERADVAVEWEGRRARVARSGGFDRLDLRFQSLGAWFGVGGGLEHAGSEIPLDELLLAVEQGRRFVRLGEAEWLQLDETLRDGLGRAAGALRSGLDGQASALHAPALDELRDAGAQVDAPTAWWQQLEAIDAAAAMEPDVPEALTARLRSYQRDGFAWLARLAEWAGGAVLADDMGLGKTVQALALLLRRSERPALVVAPASVGWNWRRECERFAPTLRVVEYRGPRRAELLAGLGGGALVVTSWDLMARDVDALAELEWGTVVFDEAQAAKNPRTRRSRAARRLPAGFRLALTGTPVENHAGELHALLAVLLPGLLGSSEQFGRRYLAPIARGDEGPRRALSRLIAPFVLRRKKAEVAPELPPRTELRRSVVLSPAERQVYERIRSAGLAGLLLSEQGSEPQQRMRVLALLTRLRQAACHPRLADPASGAASSKTAAVLELLESLRQEGHSALVFSQFVGHLELVRDALTGRGFSLAWLTGATPQERRKAEVDRFQAGGVDAFLISIKAGGTGLNLTAASYVVHLDPWWNPAVEDQATDRAHRIGQTQAVTVYRFISEDTVEEQILDLHERKRELVEGLLAGTGSTRALTTRELLELISSSGEVGEAAGAEGSELPPPSSIAAALSPPPVARTPGPSTAAEVPPPADEPELAAEPPIGEPPGADLRAADWATLLDRLRRDVEVSVARRATARSYVAVAEELVRWFELDGAADASWPELAGSVERLRKAIDRGEWTGRRTPFHQGRLVLRRLRGLDVGGA